MPGGFSLPFLLSNALVTTPDKHFINYTVTIPTLIFRYTSLHCVTHFRKCQLLNVKTIPFPSECEADALTLPEKYSIQRDIVCH